MWMGTKLSLLQRSGKGGLGWQAPKPTPKGSTLARSTETTSKMTSKLKLSKAPKHTEIYPGGTTWQIPISSKKAMGGRDGKTKL